MPKTIPPSVTQPKDPRRVKKVAAPPADPAATAKEPIMRSTKGAPLPIEPHLGPVGNEFRKRLIAHLKASKNYNPIDNFAIGFFAFWVETFVEMSRVMAKPDFKRVVMVRSSTNGELRPVIAPEFVLLEKAEANMAKYYRQFGTTPYSRERINGFLDDSSTDGTDDPIAAAVGAAYARHGRRGEA